jgi:hypothetical protein
MKKSLAILLSSALFTGLVLVQSPSLSAASSKSKAKDAKSTASSTAAPAAAAGAPSASDIAAAKSKGLVWFNTNSKVYHYSSDKVYGNSKNGKFMTEADAKAAGGKAAGGSAAPASTPAPAPAPAKAAAPAPAPAAAPAAAPVAKTTTAKAEKAPPPPPPNAGDIAAAKAKGLVWLNLNTKVYHNSGDKEYGTTKNGKFVTEADAKAAGAKLASK